jgi:hypothetical protein
MGIRAALENLMIDKVGDQGRFKANADALLKAGYLSVRQEGTLLSILDAGNPFYTGRWERNDPSWLGTHGRRCRHPT